MIDNFFLKVNLDCAIFVLFSQIAFLYELRVEKVDDSDIDLLAISQMKRQTSENSALHKHLTPSFTFPGGSEPIVR